MQISWKVRHSVYRDNLCSNDSDAVFRRSLLLARFSGRGSQKFTGHILRDGKVAGPFYLENYWKKITFKLTLKFQNF